MLCDLQLHCLRSKLVSSRHRRYRNFLQAAAAGAVKGLPIVAATLANQICFVSLLDFADSVISWFASRGGFTGFTFKVGVIMQTIMLAVRCQI